MRPPRPRAAGRPHGLPRTLETQACPCPHTSPTAVPSPPTPPDRCDATGRWGREVLAFRCQHKRPLSRRKRFLCGASRCLSRAQPPKGPRGETRSTGRVYNARLVASGGKPSPQGHNGTLFLPHLGCLQHPGIYEDSARSPVASCWGQAWERLGSTLATAGWGLTLMCRQTSAGHTPDELASPAAPTGWAQKQSLCPGGLAGRRPSHHRDHLASAFQ